MKNILIFLLLVISNIGFAQIISRDSVGAGATAALGGTELDPTVLSSVKDGVDYSEVTNTPNTITTAQSNAITTNSNHATRTDNPHSVTAAQVGLGNVDNTSDISKPISTATQTALNSKQNTLTFDSAPTNSSTNPVTSGGVFTAINSIDAGVTSFNTRTGAISPLVGDYSSFYMPLVTTNTAYNLNLGTTAGTVLEGNADLTADDLSDNSTDDLSEGSTNKYYPSADATKLSNIEANATADQIASEVPFTATGNTTSTNTQDAIVELQTEIDGITPITVENVLTSTSTTNALSAAQGKALKDALDAEISSTNSEQATQDAAITLNNAKVSADGSVTSHSDVTNAGSGQIITTAERTILGEAVQTLTWNDAPNQLIISDGNAVILSGFANATHTHDIGDITGVTTEFIMAGTFNPATAGTNAAILNQRLFWGTDGALYSKGGAGTITQIGAN